ncbi:MAG: 3D domain-containing protein [Candidatus Humimicrobiia bacterium]
MDLNRVKNLPIIAVDPDIIPLYSIVEIENLGAFIALDTGGLIKGNRIDILFNSKSEATEFGKQIMKVRIIKKEDI